MNTQNNNQNSSNAMNPNNALVHVPSTHNEKTMKKLNLRKYARSLRDLTARGLEATAQGVRSTSTESIKAAATCAASKVHPRNIRDLSADGIEATARGLARTADGLRTLDAETFKVAKRFAAKKSTK